MTQRDVSATITADMDNFIPISGKPKDNDLHRLSECLTTILLGTPYNTVDGNNTLYGILSSDATYKSLQKQLFAPPK